MEIDDEWGAMDNVTQRERACDTLLACIVTTLNHGLRNGGGVGDVLRQVGSGESSFGYRVLYDLSFFFFMIVITLNLILGIIIDTFTNIREDKEKKMERLKNTCFICGLERSEFDAKGKSFEKHIERDHDLWSYLNFIVLLLVSHLGNWLCFFL